MGAGAEDPDSSAAAGALLRREVLAVAARCGDPTARDLRALARGGLGEGPAAVEGQDLDAERRPGLAEGVGGA